MSSGNMVKVIVATFLLLFMESGWMGVATGEAADNLTAKDPGKTAPAVSTDKAAATAPTKTEKAEASVPTEPAAPKLIRHSVKISAVGDCTIGWDDRFPRGNRFDTYLENNGGDYGYYLAKVREVFREDDLTIANLECVLSDNFYDSIEQFVFLAPAAYGNILSQGGVDFVTLANNHTMDFGENAYSDTAASLDAVGVKYAGEDEMGALALNALAVLRGERAAKEYK